MMNQTEGRLFTPTDHDRTDHVKRTLEAIAQDAQERVKKAAARLEAAQEELDRANSVLADFVSVTIAPKQPHEKALDEINDRLQADEKAPSTDKAVNPFAHPNVSEDVKKLDAERMAGALAAPGSQPGTKAVMHWAGQTVYELEDLGFVNGNKRLALRPHRQRPTLAATADARVIAEEFAKATRLRSGGLINNGNTGEITLIFHGNMSDQSEIDRFIAEARRDAGKDCATYTGPEKPDDVGIELMIGGPGTEVAFVVRGGYRWCADADAEMIGHKLGIKLSALQRDAIDVFSYAGLLERGEQVEDHSNEGDYVPECGGCALSIQNNPGEFVKVKTRGAALLPGEACICRGEESACPAFKPLERGEEPADPEAAFKAILDEVLTHGQVQGYAARVRGINTGAKLAEEFGTGGRAGAQGFANWDSKGIRLRDKDGIERTIMWAKAFRRLQELIADGAFDAGTVPCPECDGDGRPYAKDGSRNGNAKCPECGGSGRVVAS